MKRRLVTVAAWLIVLALVVPQAVEAASAAFTSGSAATPAVKGTNSASANGAKGVEGYASGTAGTTYGVFGTSRSPSGAGVYGQNVVGSGPAQGLYGKTASANGHAVEGYAASTSGSQHFGGFFVAQGSGGGNPTTGSGGVFGWAKGAVGQVNGVSGRSESSEGNGVFGYAPGEFGWGVYGVGADQGVHGEGNVGVAAFGATDGVRGETGAIGDGSLGVFSLTDLGVKGHLVGSGSNLAGTCTVPNGTAASPSSGTGACLFDDAFDQSIGQPIVTLTATEDPGSLGYWVTLIDDGAGNWTGLVAHTTGNTGSDLTFNFHVVGIDASLASLSAARAVRRAAKHDWR